MGDGIIEKHSETQVEQRLCTKIWALGGIPYKFKSPNRKHVPDRLCVLPWGVCIFVEVKKPDEELRKGQMAEIAKLHRLGHLASVVSNYAEVDRFISIVKGMLKEAEQRYRALHAKIEERIKNEQ